MILLRKTTSQFITFSIIVYYFRILPNNLPAKTSYTCRVAKRRSRKKTLNFIMTIRCMPHTYITSFINLPLKDKVNLWAYCRLRQRAIVFEIFVSAVAMHPRGKESLGLKWNSGFTIPFWKSLWDRRRLSNDFSWVITCQSFLNCPKIYSLMSYKRLTHQISILSLTNENFST